MCTPDTLPEIESYETDMLTCPYNRGIPHGICLSGCREEPACKVNVPRNGWHPRGAHGRYIRITREQLDAMAQKRWNQYCEEAGFSPDDRPRLSFDQANFGRDITCRGVYQAFDGRWYGYDFEGALQTGVPVVIARKTTHMAGPAAMVL